MVNSVNNSMFNPIRTRRPDTTGVLANRTSTNIFTANAGSSSTPNIFSSSGSAETSGACACGSSGGSSGGGGGIIA